MDTRGRLALVRSAAASAASAGRDRFAIDARALAAFRIGLGLLILADLLGRARSLEAFYTDAGVLPRSVLLARAHPLHLSLHGISGEAWFQVALFLVAGVFAVALAIGYRTSTATVASWVLLVSLHNRNWLVLNGGDVLFRMLLFWAVFLPLAERWSVDSLRADRRRLTVASTATAALLLQVVVVYATNAALKLTGDAWLRGEALEYVFSLGQFTTPLGDVLASYPGVLAALDYLWFGMVVGSFLLIALPGRWRSGFALAFVGMHLGMALTMRLGLFPLVSIVALLPFLHGGVLASLERRLARSRLDRAITWSRTRLDAVLPTVAVSGVPGRLRRGKRLASTAVPLVFLVLVVLWNVQFAGIPGSDRDPLPDEVEPAIELTRSDQYWNMFAPDPLSTDGWIVAPGHLENGTRVDAFHGGVVDWDRPPDVGATYPTARWRKYLVGLWQSRVTHRRHFAEYLCRHWSADHDADLRNVSVYFVEQPTRIDEGTEPTDRVRLADRRC